MNARAESGQEKAPSYRGAFSAERNQHKYDFATNQEAEKCLSTWQARYAIGGKTLYRPASADGAILYLSLRWGTVREMKSLEAVAAFFALIGGKV